MKINISKVAHLSGHRDSIYALCLVDAETVLTGSADGMVVKWRPFESTDGVLIMQLSKPVYCLHALPDGRVLAGSADGVIYILEDAATGQVRAIQAHEAGIFDLKPYGEGWLSASGDGTVAHWDSDFKLLHRYPVSSKSIRTLLPMADGSICCGSSDWLVYRIIPGLKEYETFDGHQQSVFALATNGENSGIFSAGRDAQIIRRSASGRAIEILPAHLYSIHHLAMHPEGKWMLSCSMDKTIKLWQCEPFKLLKVIDHERHQSHTNCVNKVLWIDANHFISCADDRTALVFQLEIDQHHDIK